MRTKTPLQVLGLLFLLSPLLSPASWGQGVETVNLSFTILNIDTGSPLPGVNIFAFDENNKFVFEGTTNMIGVYTVGTKLRPGQKIRVMVQKEGYKVFTKDFEITNPSRQENTWEIKLIPKERILIPDQPDQAVTGNDFDDPLSGHVYDARAYRRGRQVPIEGVRIDILVEDEDRRIPKGQTDKKGYFIIYHDLKAGQGVTLFLEKTPEYLEKEYLYTYREYGNVLPLLYLERDRKVPCKCWFWTGGAVVAGGSYFFLYREYQKRWDRYNDLDNLDVHYSSEAERQQDLDKAGLFKGLGLGGMAIGAAAIIGGPFLCKWMAPKEAGGDVNGVRIRPGFYGYDANGPGPGLSLVATF